MTITARRRKDGSVAYGVSVFDAGAQRWVGTFDTRSDARTAEAEAGAPGTDETFPEFADVWLANRKPFIEPTTYDNYRFYLRRARDYFGDTPLHSITDRDCASLSALLATDLAPLTARSALIVVQAVLADGAPHLGKLTKPKRPQRRHDIRPLSRMEQVHLLFTCPGQYRTMFAVWPIIGLRPSEMYGLKPEDVQPDGLHVDRQHVRGKVRAPKYGSRRIVALTAKARALLTEHQTTWSPDGWLFTTAQGCNLDTANFGGCIWPDIRDAAGLPDVHLHDLRHTFASNCLAGGLDVRTLSEYLGHKSAKVTLDTYCHLIPADSSEKAAALGRALA